VVFVDAARSLKSAEGEWSVYGGGEDVLSSECRRDSSLVGSAPGMT